MNLKFLVPTLRCACQSALIAHELNTVGPRAGFVLGYDNNGNPHMLYVEDAANSKRPAHITCGELLQVEIKGIAGSVASLNLPPEQGADRMVFALLTSLSSLLYGLKSDDSRTLQLAGLINEHAVAGIMLAVTEKPPQPSPAVCQQPERN